MNLRSSLKNAKGLGSSKNGFHHWWMQRVTAIALIPLVIWFILLVVKAATGQTDIVHSMSRPFNAVLMILFIGSVLYHGALGLRVIIEDYVHCHCGRPALIIITNFVAIVTAVSLVLAVLSVNLGANKRGQWFHKQYKEYCGETSPNFNLEKCTALKEKAKQRMKNYQH